MTRSTASRRAKNSDSVIREDLLPESLPSRLLCFLASRRVEPFTLVGSLLGALGSRGVLTLTTTLGATSPSTASPDLLLDLTLRCESSAGTSSTTAGLLLLLFVLGAGKSGAWKISEKPAAAGAAFGSSTGADSLGSAPFFFDFLLGAITSATTSATISLAPRLRDGFFGSTTSSTGTSLFFLFTI